jgi:HemY protein
VPDPAYICSRCGGESGDWQPLCPHCASFDALTWRTPPRGGVAGRLMITAERLPMVLPAPNPVLSPADAADS